MTSSVDHCRSTSRFAYDSRGNLTHATDPKATATLGCPGTANTQGNSTTYVYDGASRRIRTIVDLRAGGVGSGAIDTSNPLNADGRITTIAEWDGNGRLVRQTDDKSNATRYTYDELNRLLTETFADGEARRFIYDKDDHVTVYQDPNGSTQTCVYDAGDLVTSCDYSPGPGIVGTTRTTCEYDGMGRPTRCTDNNDPSSTLDDSVIECDWDSLGRPLEQLQNNRPVTLEWFGADRRTAMIYPNGRRLLWTYDPLDRVKTIQDQGAATPIARYDYLGPARLLERTLQNGVRLTHLVEVVKSVYV
jgi:YD repeat-containing protein